jgi:tetrahydromethanopterin S-methyltransferase subunit G
VPKISTGKLIGIVFGCIVVAVMVFMMFAILAGLIRVDQ